MTGRAVNAGCEGNPVSLTPRQVDVIFRTVYENAVGHTHAHAQTHTQRQKWWRLLLSGSLVNVGANGAPDHDGAHRLGHINRPEAVRAHRESVTGKVGQGREEDVREEHRGEPIAAIFVGYVFGGASWLVTTSTLLPVAVEGMALGVLAHRRGHGTWWQTTTGTHLKEAQWILFQMTAIAAPVATELAKVIAKTRA